VFLWKFERVQVTETAANLSTLIGMHFVGENNPGFFALGSVVKELSQQGVQVISGIADNARNIQKSLRIPTEQPLLPLNCFAHSANLLLKPSFFYQRNLGSRPCCPVPNPV